MSTEKQHNDGGPAFPVVGMSQIHGQAVTVAFNAGMTLRDYFAAKAMQGSRSRLSDYKTWDDLARDAYEIADAMLKARDAK